MTIRHRTAVLILFVVLIAVVAVPGCLSTKAPVKTTSTLPALLLDYHRTGGIAGTDDRLVIFDNGVALLSTRAVNREFMVNASEIERVHQVFGQAGFAAMKGNYTSAFSGTDIIQYSITYQNRTVMTEDTSVPFTLQPVIRELDGLVDRGISQDPVAGSLAGLRT
jgi:hypothetical protein